MSSLSNPQFDLTEVIKHINQHEFQRIVCQFPDEYLHISTEIYLSLEEQISPSCDVFITADSSFGSSVDDISAGHVDSDLLVYFGSDMSGSGGMNVMIVPPVKDIDVKKCCQTLITSYQDVDQEEDGVELPQVTTLLIFDPCYLHERDNITTTLLEHIPNLETGQLPNCLGITGNWLPLHEQEVIKVKNSLTEQIGGVYFSVQDVVNAKNVLYIGEKDEQLASIFLRMSKQRVIRYSPQEASKQQEDGLAIEVFQGDTTKVFRERFGGVSKVKDAKIIGLLIGSMGIETTNLQTIVHQLQQLITTAGKKYYVFVLGRINEAKLCNFPEVCCVKLLIIIKY